MRDRKVNLREIADILKIPDGSAFIIFHESISMRKQYSRWVLRLLSFGNNLLIIENTVWRNKKDFFIRKIWQEVTHGLRNGTGS